MKQHIFLFALTAFVATAFVGCKNEDPSEHHFDNKPYISAAAFTDEMLIKNAVSGYSRDITVGIPTPESSDIDVEIGAAPDLLDRYRMAYYDTDAELLGVVVCRPCRCGRVWAAIYALYHVGWLFHAYYRPS